MSRKVYAVLALMMVLALGLSACGATPAEPAAPEPTAAGGTEATAAPEVPTAPPVEAGEVLIRLWAQANDVEHWRADNAIDAAKLVTDYQIEVQAINDSASWGDYKKKFTLAADAGEGPEIVLSGHEDVPVWANAGYIVEFDTCREMYPEFDDVIESLWESGTWNGKVWAVPQDTEARPMYYSKTKLAELGWSQEEIDALPERIAEGDFTLDDLIATAKEAIEQGVVEPGYGYWHRPSKGGDFLQYYAAYGGRIYDEASDKLVISREALVNFYAFQRRVVDEGITPENYIGTESNIWHDTVSHDQALFWNGGVWNWSNWAKNFVADEGGNDYLYSFIGYALQPSGIKGQPGVTLSHPLVYMITSEKTSGTDLYNESCALLAKITTPELNTRHAIDSTHLGILNAQASDPAYTQDKLLSETLSMLDYAFYQPNHTMYTPWFDIVYDGMLKAENGEASPEKAAEDVIKLLQTEIGDFLIVED